MYTEALRLIREAKPKAGGVVSETGGSRAAGSRGRKLSPQERRAFYERFTRRASVTGPAAGVAENSDTAGGD